MTGSVGAWRGHARATISPPAIDARPSRCSVCTGLPIATDPISGIPRSSG
jgi:hypothetical protein